MTRPALIFLSLLAAVPRASFGQGFALASCPCTLKGRVLNSVTGAPVRNALGDFRISDLPSGSYILLVAPPDARPYRPSGNDIPSGYPRVYYPGVLDRSAATPIKVSAGRESIANLTLATKPFVRLSGRVSGYQVGSPVQIVLDQNSESEGSSSIKVDPRTGTFQTDWIPPGNYTLSAAAPEEDSATAQPWPLTSELSVSASSSLSDLNLVLLRAISVPVSVEGLERKEDLGRLAVQLTARETGA